MEKIESTKTINATDKKTYLIRSREQLKRYYDFIMESIEDGKALGVTNSQAYKIKTSNGTTIFIEERSIDLDGRVSMLVGRVMHIVDTSIKSDSEYISHEDFVFIDTNDQIKVVRSIFSNGTVLNISFNYRNTANTYYSSMILEHKSELYSSKEELDDNFNIISIDMEKTQNKENW